MGKEAADRNYGACGVWNCGRGNYVTDRGLGTLTQIKILEAQASGIFYSIEMCLKNIKKTLLHLHMQNKIII